MASAPGGVDAAAAAAALLKPERPRAPRVPDLRKVTDPAKREAKLAAHELAVADHKRKLQEYEDVLYPAYRAASKKAARPVDDGAKAVQRRQESASAAAAHAARERARQAELADNVQGEWEQTLRDFAERCADDAGYLQDLHFYLDTDEEWYIRERQVRRGDVEYKVEWLNIDVHIWARFEHLAQHRALLDAVDARARGEREPRRGAPICGAAVVPVKRACVKSLQLLRRNLSMHGYTEGVEQYTDSEAEYGESDDEN